MHVHLPAWHMQLLRCFVSARQDGPHLGSCTGREAPACGHSIPVTATVRLARLSAHEVRSCAQVWCFFTKQPAFPGAGGREKYEEFLEAAGSGINEKQLRVAAQKAPEGGSCLATTRQPQQRRASRGRRPERETVRAQPLSDLQSGLSQSALTCGQQVCSAQVSTPGLPCCSAWGQTPSCAECQGSQVANIFLVMLDALGFML